MYSIVDNSCAPEKFTIARFKPGVDQESDLNTFDYEKGQYFPNVELSSCEIAFAFLIDSFALAWKLLNETIIGALKDKHKSSWKDIMCSCFSIGIKKQVFEFLDNGRTINDIFVVCKIIRYRLYDVTNFVGEELLDPRNKERLSLQVQGVEAARHMASHGE